MTAPSDQYGDWDAAYVLGALGPDDRRDFERHLAECEACSRAVAELAGLPGLLAAVPAEQALAVEGRQPEGADAARMPDTTLPRLLAAARRERVRSRRLLVGAIAVVAVVAAAGALAVAGWFGAPAPGSSPSASEPAASPPPTPTSPPETTLAMVPVVPGPVSAELTLQAQPWGTRIVSRCSYAEAYKGGSAAYALYLTDRQGETSLLATWRAGPGTTVTPVGTTSLTEADIATVDIRSLASGQVLLESRLAP